MTAQTFSVRDKRVTVVGAARSGIAAAHLLVRRGASVTLTDKREDIADADRLRSAGVRLELGAHETSTFTNADLIVLSPGVPASIAELSAARAAGVPVIGELELASRWLRGRIVAITGTKGKSTTTTLTGRMLEAAGHKVLVGGNIGNALSAQVDDSTDQTIHVVETSSFQLESIETFRPWIAVLLNFSPDHLDRHGDVEEYARAKSRVFVNQTADDWAVLNADDESVIRMAADAASRRLLFSMTDSLASGVLVHGDSIVRRTAEGDTPLVPLASVRLLGRHLIADVLAASAVASLIGVDAAAMTEAVEQFTGLEHALEPVAEFGGVMFVNDSKATNIEAARRAIESFDADRRHPRRPIQGRGLRRSAAVARGSSGKCGGDRRVEGPGRERPGRRGAGARGIGHERRRSNRVRGGGAGCNGGACARVRKFRHVSRLRGARPRVQAGSPAARRGVEKRA